MHSQGDERPDANALARGRVGGNGVGGVGERRRRDLATSADRRECAEVSKARSKNTRSVSTHRHKHEFMATGGIIN